MLRRVLVPLLLSVAMLCGVLSWKALTPPAPAADEYQLATSVLSPRRLPSVLANASSDSALRQAIRDLQASRPLSGSSCLVVRRDGRPVIVQNPDQPLVPASTHKVLTAAAVLERFGPDGRFTTEVRAAKEAERGVVEGPLFLVGGGDPMLATDAFIADSIRPPEAFTPIDALAKAVADAGVRVVTGGVAVDDNLFDDQRSIATWDPGYRRQGEVGSIGALTVNYGFGPPPIGRFAAGDPGVEAATAFVAALGRAGVEVQSGISRADTPRNSELVAELESPPASVIVGHLLTNSDNTTAEILLKNLAVADDQPGETVFGGTELVDALALKGLDTRPLNVADGSGLSRDNRATCGLVEGALNEGGPDGALAGGLAKAGETGTLDQRLRGTPAQGTVRAKTGSLAGVTALAGWAASPASPGAPTSFATIANGVNAEASRAYEDQLALLLVNPPSSPPVERFAPDSPRP